MVCMVNKLLLREQLRLRYELDPHGVLQNCSLLLHLANLRFKSMVWLIAIRWSKAQEVHHIPSFSPHWQKSVKFVMMSGHQLTIDVGFKQNNDLNLMYKMMFGFFSAVLIERANFKIWKYWKSIKNENK